MNEPETRAEHIDPALAAAGWGVTEGSRILREVRIAPGRIEGRGRRGKPIIADYVLVYRNIRLSGIGAKAWDRPVTEGVGQAKDYSEKMAVRFAYSSNGQGCYGIDMKTGNEGELSRYPTPGELWAMTFAVPNAWRDRFAAVPFKDKGGSHLSRCYQDIAVERVMEAVAENQPRILMMTTFWHPDGTPMSAQQFMEMLFGRLPEFFTDEAELRALWSAPDTRAKLMQGLAEQGFGHDQLAEMQRNIDAEKSDLFDVLTQVACALAVLTREERATKARTHISARFNNRQQAFSDFVLSQYTRVGVDEPNSDKRSPLLKLKYNNSMPAAVEDLGKPEEIGKVFSGFQKYHYHEAA